MKILRFFLTITLTYSPLWVINTHAQNTIILASDPWPPFVLGNEGEQATEGVGVELIRTIFSRIKNTTVHIPLMPWKRALNDVKQGRIDGVPFLYKNPERMEYMVFTDPLFLSQDLAWYSKKQHPQGLAWQTIDDLAPYTIGGVRGYSYSPDINQAKAQKKITYVETDNADQLFTMLAGGRIDIALANKVVGSAQAKLHAPDIPITSMDKAIAEAYFYMGLSKKRQAKELIPQINQALTTLKAEGEIERIIYMK